MQCFKVAQLGFWRNKWGFIGGVEDTANGMLVMVQKMDAERAAAKWQEKVHARIQGLGHAMGMITQAAHAAQACEVGMGGGHGNRTAETGGDLFDGTATGAEHGAGTGMGIGRC